MINQLIYGSFNQVNLADELKSYLPLESVPKSADTLVNG